MKIYQLFFVIVCSLWIGWRVGNDGGYRRGVIDMSALVSSLLDARNAATIQPPPKYTDL